VIKYRTRWDEIEAVEVLRETDKMVFLPGRGRSKEEREAKRSDYQNWFDSWDEAKAFLVADAEKAVEAARMNLERAKGKLVRLRGMREA